MGGGWDGEKFGGRALVVFDDGLVDSVYFFILYCIMVLMRLLSLLVERWVYTPRCGVTLSLLPTTSTLHLFTLQSIPSGLVLGI